MSTLLLERMFKGSEKLIQLSLKPKNLSFNRKSERRSKNMSCLGAQNVCLSERGKKVLNYEVQSLFIEARRL